MSIPLPWFGASRPASKGTAQVERALLAAVCVLAPDDVVVAVSKLADDPDNGRNATVPEGLKQAAAAVRDADRSASSTDPVILAAAKAATVPSAWVAQAKATLREANAASDSVLWAVVVDSALAKAVANAARKASLSAQLHVDTDHPQAKVAALRDRLDKVEEQIREVSSGKATSQSLRKLRGEFSHHRAAANQKLEALSKLLDPKETPP